MSEQTVYFYPTGNAGKSPASTEVPRLEPATCTEAESFVLRVLDDSMEPEFRKGCMIVIDPTGRATDGSYVLAHRPLGESDTVSDETSETEDAAVGDYVFRQLCRFESVSVSGSRPDQWKLRALNPKYPQESEAISLDSIVGVIVQRAGVRRAYHKRYD